MYTVKFVYIDKSKESEIAFNNITKIVYIALDEVILEGDAILTHQFTLFSGQQIITLFSEKDTYNVSSLNVKYIQVSKQD